ncbi:hypothetical protein HAX54_015847 [Datura stramonium]|uniref:Uncharacterized protein n=1 Tax=Datura stramonium TaxID=4076 RepID=A0ABS8Y6B7_DATST|nr:hypothetical protein [Datura stramonium]
MEKTMLVVKKTTPVAKIAPVEKVALVCSKILSQDKFEVHVGLSKHKLQGFVIRTMQRLFRAWKARLRILCSSYNTYEDRLSHRS